LSNFPVNLQMAFMPVSTKKMITVNAARTVMSPSEFYSISMEYWKHFLGSSRKCLAICGKKDVALPLGTGCEVHLPKALQCMEGRTENLVLQKMVKYRQPLTAFSGFRQKQNNDNIECTTLHGACLTAASTCQLLSQFASPFGAICSLGVGAACAVETLSQDCFQEQ
jgi:hypothetical protein